MSAEERIAELEALLRRTQEFVGMETEAESREVWISFPATYMKPQTRSELLRKEADTLERRDALIVEVRQALGQARHSAARINTWVS